MTDPSAALRKKLKPRTLARGPCCDVLEEESPGLFRKTAKSLLKLDLVVEDCRAKRLPPEAALAAMPEPCLPMLITASGDRMGLFVLDGDLVDGLIEQQLLGYVARAPRIDRPVTRIDGELSRGFVAALLKSLNADLAEDPRAEAVCGFATPVMETDRATLELALSAPAYDVLDLTLDLGGGQKKAQAQLWFPDAGDLDATPGAGYPAAWQQQMRESVLSAPIRVEARLPPVPISIADFAGLRVGVTLPLPGNILQQAMLVDVAGNEVATGRLGQLNGVRAFRIATVLSEQDAPAQEVLPGPDLADLAAPAPGLPAEFAPDPAPAFGDEAGQGLTGGPAPVELPPEMAEIAAQTPDMAPLADTPLPDAPLPDLPASDDAADLPDMPDFPAMAVADIPVPVD
ncbi:MAG: FliM/FliN family flagellar motor switch protein [Paracoccaceae bacterium]